MGYGGGRKQQEYDNNMHGALFDGDPQKDTDPDMRGQCEVDGVEYWVAAWWKKSKKVGDFLSFALTPKDEQSNQRNDRRGPSRGPSSAPRGRGGPPARRDDPQERRSDRGRDGDDEDDGERIPF